MKRNEQIRLLRISLGYSQQWVAGKLNISQDQYSKIERGYKPISDELEYQLITLLGGTKIEDAGKSEYTKSTISSVILLQELFAENYTSEEAEMIKQIILAKEKVVLQQMEEIKVLKKILSNYNQQITSITGNN